MQRVGIHALALDQFIRTAIVLAKYAGLTLYPPPKKQAPHLAIAAGSRGPADDPPAGGDQLHRAHFDLVYPGHQDQRAVLAEPCGKI